MSTSSLASSGLTWPCAAGTSLPAAGTSLPAAGTVLPAAEASLLAFGGVFG